MRAAKRPERLHPRPPRLYRQRSCVKLIAIVYFVSYATRELALGLTATLTVLVLAALVFAVSLVTFATWSDR